MEYAMKMRSEEDLDVVDKRVRDALDEEGFGILTEIDVQATLLEKLGVERGPYRILGACNPPLADEGLQAERDLGVLLPCNVVLYEDDEGIVVSAMRPTAVLDLLGNPRVGEIARDVEARVWRAMEAALPKGEALTRAGSGE